MTRRAAAVHLRVRVIPRARSNALSCDASGTLRARLTAPPVEGAANRALIDLLARALDVKRGDLNVAQGERGRDKVIAVRGISEAELRARIAGLAADDVDNAGRRG